jgi:hypothetical protein
MQKKFLSRYTDAAARMKRERGETLNIRNLFRTLERHVYSPKKLLCTTKRGGTGFAIARPRGVEALARMIAGCKGFCRACKPCFEINIEFIEEEQLMSSEALC